MNAFNVLFASIALLAAGYIGFEYRDYQVKRDACKIVSDFATATHRTLDAGHPCQSYL